jgi:hypothetical protein
MKRMTFATILFAIATSVWAGKVYRCPDGSYQDKPCGEGERLLTTNNHGAAPPPGADKACFERGREAARLARLREAGLSFERLAEGIERGGKPYEQQLSEKAFAVQVYQSKGSAAEIATIFESDCVAKNGATATPQGQATLPSVQPPAVESEQASKAASQRDQLCGRLKRDGASIRAHERKGGSIEDMESLADQRRAIEQQLRELCS